MGNCIPNQGQDSEETTCVANMVPLNKAVTPKNFLFKNNEIMPHVLIKFVTQTQVFCAPCIPVGVPPTGSTRPSELPAASVSSRYSEASAFQS